MEPARCCLHRDGGAGSVSPTSPAVRKGRSTRVPRDGRGLAGAGRLMLTDADVIAFVTTTDLARARAFYEGVLGLPVVEDDGFAMAFDAHGTMLRVTGVREL